MDKKTDLEKLDKKFIQKMLTLSEEERTIEIDENFESYLTSLPKGEYKKLLLKKMWGVYLESSAKKTEVEISISEAEADFIKGLPTDEIKRIFYSLICKSKVRPHPSGWIRLDFNETMKYGFEMKQAAKLKIDCLSQCRAYGFDAMVVGSNDPVVCFKIPKFEDSEAIAVFVESESVNKYKELFL